MKNWWCQDIQLLKQQSYNETLRNKETVFCAFRNPWNITYHHIALENIKEMRLRSSTLWGWGWTDLQVDNFPDLHVVNKPTKHSSIAKETTLKTSPTRLLVVVIAVWLTFIYSLWFRLAFRLRSPEWSHHPSTSRHSFRIIRLVWLDANRTEEFPRWPRERMMKTGYRVRQCEKKTESESQSQKIQDLLTHSQVCNSPWTAIKKGWLM